MALKDFHTRIEVIHYPTGHSFRQQGFRIRVEDENGYLVETFTSTELQELRDDQLISLGLLRRLANRWVGANLQNR